MTQQVLPTPQAQTQLQDGCPNCKADLQSTFALLGSSRLSFCPSCQFPLMTLAGKYQLQRKLAKGGYGVVYLARHIRLTYEPERVIKFILPEVFEIEGMESRFEREVQVTSVLSQRTEHIVRIYDDFGHIPKLGHFYVMEYLQGQPLHHVLRESEALMPMDVVATLFGQLCDAIHTSHQLGVVHRDLKPQNLYVVAKEHHPHFLKVLDFGIAKPLHQKELSSTSLTQGVLGTPAYMSPEQCTNSPIDGRADIYAMGIILYELLTGQTPFVPNEADSKSTPVMQILSAHISKPPPNPHALAPHRVTTEMAQVICRCLKKAPRERFQSVADLKAAFQEAMERTPAVGTLQLASGTHSVAELGQSQDTEPQELAHAETLDATPQGVPPLRVGQVETPLPLPRAGRPKRRQWLWLAVSGVCLALCGALMSAHIFARPKAPRSSEHSPKATKQGGSLDGHAAKARRRMISQTPQAPKRRPKAARVAVRPRPARRAGAKVATATPTKRRRAATRPRPRRRKATPRVRPRRRKAVSRRRPHCKGPKGTRWATLIVRPGKAPHAAKVLGKKGSSKIVSTRGGYCVKVQQTVYIQLSAKGFIPCHIKLPPHGNTYVLRLQKTKNNELEMDDLDYCLKRPR